MLVLPKGERHGIRVSPRWPSSEVAIDEETFHKLIEAQSTLPPDIELLLVRGYENKNSHLGSFRTLSRWLGIKVFCACYPGRKDEVGEIFGANGHDVDGSHVDVSIVLKGKRLRLLPFGVFTSLTRQRARAAHYLVVIDRVKDALKQCGFDIHRNETESMQIHCDYKPQKS
ncbi:hypothetical protein HFV04_023875 [Pseudomonas sp. BIGb0427]|uniref:Uncharacterized protein n=1 Tax=Pseudomonas vranovensis TaxID=321661 RepID=A0A423DM97_9PSED|nr:MULTISPECIES: hypothetical protein [Pseudomonas]QPG62531.1 hypothetical protein HFV04_023875 [Pseudomonas sp. BIGb0427]ROL72666.1 hypothetical protein BHU25_13705 [Pseudomonas vranovensis]UVM64876.1 hypothetical protein LOY34_16160 [Pseudomonas sp. B21-009]